MSSTYSALLASSILSILLSTIQVSSDAKAYDSRSLFTLPFFFFVVMSIIGNCMTTLVAIGIVDAFQEDRAQVLAGPRWIWYSFVGVFGFELIVQKINITFFDQGVLSINDWITKAKKNATGATVERLANLLTEDGQKLANKLCEKLDDQSIKTLAMKQLGADGYQQLIDSIENIEEIDHVQFLAHILAEDAPKLIKAEIKAKNSSNV